MNRRTYNTYSVHSVETALCLQKIKWISHVLISVDSLSHFPIGNIIEYAQHTFNIEYATCIGMCTDRTYLLNIWSAWIVYRNVAEKLSEIEMSTSFICMCEYEYEHVCCARRFLSKIIGKMRKCKMRVTIIIIIRLPCAICLHIECFDFKYTTL